MTDTRMTLKEAMDLEVEAACSIGYGERTAARRP